VATQTERREATRSRLVEAAYERFVRDGFEATHTDSILAAAGVSRGALYHHFRSKKELFAAVFEHVSAAAVDRAVRRGRAGKSARQTLVLACLAWLKEARRPGVARILLDQGPQVLGWLAARDIENRYSLSVMKAGLQAAVDAAELETPSVELTAGVLNAALAELALVSLHGGKSVRVGLIEDTVRQMIAGLAPAGNVQRPRT
jgi:AcrR family transcriptional regulator